MSYARTPEGIALRAGRLRAGMSQRQLARAIGMRPAMIQNFESGRRILNPTTMQRLVDALNAAPAVQ